MADKASKKATSRKSAAKNTAPKKATVKQTTTKKAVANKSAASPARKPSSASVKGKSSTKAKKSAKKVTSKKVATKEAAIAASKPAIAAPVPATGVPAVTTVKAVINVGFGHHLFIRGEGAGLSWESGTPMENTASDEWVFVTTGARDQVEFKVLVDDEIWSIGENFVVSAGATLEVSPEF